MTDIKLVGVNMLDQRVALGVLNNKENVPKLFGKRNGYGYFSSTNPHVVWWVWKTERGCVCIQADYKV